MTQPLAGVSIGIVPIIWNNADITDLGPRLEASTVMDEVARLGFDGLGLAAGLTRKGLPLWKS